MQTAGTSTGASGPEAEVLRERWFACSSALGWSAPSLWPDAAVDDVCATICAGRGGVERALGRWAGARAGAGVGLAETLSDLAALHTAVAGVLGGHAEPGGDATRARSLDGARLLRAVALAWTDVTCGDLVDTSAVDPLSGLASARYLQTRLAEVYRAARAHGRRVGDEHALVGVTMSVDGWTRIAPLTVAAESAGVVFDAGESLAVLGRATLVVLAPREGLADRTRVLRRMLSRRLTPAVGVATPPAVRIVALPATHDGACALLERLGRAVGGADTGATEVDG